MADKMNWYASPRSFFEQAILPVLVAEPIDKHEQSGSQNNNQGKADERVHATDVKDSKYNEEHYKAAAQVADVLCFQSFELYGLVDAFVDLINTGCHSTDLDSEE
jgi:hypothetical protein